MIETITNHHALRKLETEWNRLGSKFDSPLLQFDWFLSCAENLHRKSDLRVIIFKTGERIKAIAPLVLRRQAMTDWLELLGSATLHEPGGLLYDDENSLDALLQAVAAAGYPVNLSRIPDTSLIRERVQTISSWRAFTLTRPTSGSYYISTEISWDTFYSRIGKNWRADFRNKKRRAEKLGNTAIDIFRPTLDQLESVLDQAIEIEAHSWKGTQGSSIRDNRLLRDFIYNYARRSCEAGTLIMCFFTINNIPIAMNLGISCGNKLWFLKTGYDQEWSRVSPGMQLNMECIRYAFDNGFDSYEFLGSEAPWQRAWPVDSHNYSTVIILPYTMKGILGFGDIVLTYAKNRSLKRS
jgi:CelD/BcsL family acetyltransferase involved in cellulose biosynthesis